MALSLGASRWRVFRTVTVPLTVPGLANAFLLLFAASLADFATPLILAGNQFPVLPTQAYLQITGLFDLRGGAALSFVLLVPALIVFLLQRYWVGAALLRHGHRQGRRPDAVRQRVAVPCASRCSRRARWSPSSSSTSTRCCSTRRWWWRSAPTTRSRSPHYQVIFTERPEGDPRHADHRRHSRCRSAASTACSWATSSRASGFAGRRTMELVSMINYALPGTIVGIAYLIAFNDPPIELTGTALIIVACYVFRYGPTGIRATVALLQQIDKSLEEASQGLGAGSGTTFRRVTLPLILPAFFAGLGVVFIRSMTAISATIFLVSIGWTLITVKILREHDGALRWDPPPRSPCSSSSSCSS